MSQRNSRDFQIHRSDPQPLRAELFENLRGRCIEWENGKLANRLNALLKAPVSMDLGAARFLSIDNRQPALRHLLDDDD